MKINNITKLLYFTILEIRGEGSKDLLQGQITCDLEKLDGSNRLFGALCNPKGRVISSFILLSQTQKNNGNYWIIGQNDMMLKMYSVLEKYTPFYKVDMDIIDSYTFYGADFNPIEAGYGVNRLYTSILIGLAISSFVMISFGLQSGFGMMGPTL